MKQKAIIVDLDGTLCLFHNKDGTPMRKPFYIEDDCYHYADDRPNKVVLEIIHRFAITHFIIFCSGRTNNNFAISSEWINNNTKLDMYALFMRPKGDFRKDSEIKEIIYRKQIEPHYDIDFVLDDRNSVVQKWRELGLTCLQVANGDF